MTATTDHQQVLETTIGGSLDDLAASAIKPPAIIVVGEVVKLRAGLDWLGALSGRKLQADPLNENARSMVAGKEAG